MSYAFVTGATGLLGTYLVRDLLKAKRQLALLIRSSAKSSAEARAATLLEHCAHELGSNFPRPVIIDGDLTAPDLGISPTAKDWIAVHCDTVLHRAASLTFNATAGTQGEPWLSNLQGTQQVLELCRQTGVGTFHYVSTAYVCGTRRGRILESETDLGQSYSNDYETSKAQAELAVKNAHFLKHVTIYRPGIIMGDSQSGYTPTFHGFYVPLKLLSSLLSRAAAVASTTDELREFSRFSGLRLIEVLNLSGRERKNFVPVDWVSKVMAHIISEPQHHDHTYHLTPNEPVRLTLVREATAEAFFRNAELAEEKVHDSDKWAHFEHYFIDGMKMYQSYWQDDPVFDTSNTRRVAPHLPCPELDSDLFMRMCNYAFETNFGRRRIATSPAV